MADEWAARDERRAREMLAICAGMGAATQPMARLSVTADPLIPDDEHPEVREYFVMVDCLKHAPIDADGGAFVNGISKRKYRIVLEEVPYESG